MCTLSNSESLSPRVTLSTWGMWVHPENSFWTWGYPSTTPSGVHPYSGVTPRASVGPSSVEMMVIALPPRMADRDVQGALRLMLFYGGRSFAY